MRTRRTAMVAAGVLVLLLASAMTARAHPGSKTLFESILTLLGFLVAATLAGAIFIVFPMVILVAGPPALHEWIVTTRRRLRQRRGLCAHCSYDRRGLPSDAPCPECGNK